MGDKAGAKARMIEAKVPTAPGYLGEDQSEERPDGRSRALWATPWLVKAVSGGGGRVCVWSISRLIWPRQL